MIIRFASLGCAHWIFIEHFSLFPRLAFHAICVLFSFFTCTHIQTHIYTHSVSCILLLLASFFTSPGILRISSILIQSHDFLPGNPSSRDGFAQYHRSCEPFSYLPSRAADAFSIPTSRPLFGLLLRDKI